MSSRIDQRDRVVPPDHLGELVSAAEPAKDKDKSAPRPIRALLITGGCCHDYEAQKKILSEGITARANVEWTIAYDSDKGTKKLNPIYENPEWYKGFDIIVHDECDADVKDRADLGLRHKRAHLDILRRQQRDHRFARRDPFALPIESVLHKRICRRELFLLVK